MPKPRDLFEDSDDETEEVPQSLKVNESYATKYDEVKRKQELQRLTDKYGVNADESDDDEESSDSDAELLTDRNEAVFAKVFASLRQDKSMKDNTDAFFNAIVDSSDDDETATKSKEFKMRDEYNRAVTSGRAGDEPAEEITEKKRKSKIVPQTEEERKQRNAFLRAAAGGSDDFEVTKKATGDDDSDEEPEWKQGFAAAFNEDNTDDRFLKNFFVNELWRGDGTGDAPNWEQVAADEQDEQFFDEQEDWEQEYRKKQFRHEEGEIASTVQTFARDQDGLRRNDNTRAAARERKAEREKQKSVKVTEELKRMKALKRKDIEEKKRAIEQVSGLDENVLGKISKADLEKDFDPAEFDKMMAKMFDPTYYDAIDDEEIKRMEDEDMLAGDVGAEFDEQEDAPQAPHDDDSDDDDLFGGIPTNDDDAAAGEGDDLELLYPSKALTGGTGKSKDGLALSSDGKTKEELEADLEKTMDEYWKLHYHKLAGGVRTRFKYREVNPERFSLTDEEVLTTDDRTLNMVAPLSAYAGYLGKKENQIDRFKAIHRRKNQRQLDPTRKSRRYGDLSKTVVLNEDMPEKEAKEIGDRIAQTKRALGDDSAPAGPVKEKWRPQPKKDEKVRKAPQAEDPLPSKKKRKD